MSVNFLLFALKHCVFILFETIITHVLFLLVYMLSVPDPHYLLLLVETGKYLKTH